MSGYRAEKGDEYADIRGNANTTGEYVEEIIKRPWRERRQYKAIVRLLLNCRDYISPYGNPAIWIVVWRFCLEYEIHVGLPASLFRYQPHYSVHGMENTVPCLLVSAEWSGRYTHHGFVPGGKGPG